VRIDAENERDSQPSILGPSLNQFAKANPPKPDYGLSPREQEILQLLVDGKTVRKPLLPSAFPFIPPTNTSATFIASSMSTRAAVQSPRR
jgi:hypothetical protein